MEVQEIMTKEFEIISSSDNILQAAKKMKKLNVGILPVRDGNKITGILTDRDIVIRALAENKDPKNVKAKDIMSFKISSCSIEDSIEEAASIMKEKQVRRLVVMDHNNMPAGILSLGDIAAKSRLEQLTGETLEAISKPCSPSRQNLHDKMKGTQKCVRISWIFVFAPSGCSCSELGVNFDSSELSIYLSLFKQLSYYTLEGINIGFFTTKRLIVF